ncbi:MAG: hydrogenase maturation protease [Bacteroides sp.]|jgi:hydrogenase maturation protease|nr:hydrogenase maturation protease [Bacteroides sp.]
MDRIRRLLSNKNLRIVFAGIGNVLRSDDGAGPIIAQKLNNTENRIVIIPEAGIERYISAINREKPDLIVFFDCVNFGRHPGYWELIPINKIVETTSHSHNISLHKLAEFFFAETWVVGIQPANIEVGEKLSPEVEKSAQEIISLFNSI